MVANLEVFLPSTGFILADDIVSETKNYLPGAQKISCTSDVP